MSYELLAKAVRRRSDDLLDFIVHDETLSDNEARLVRDAAEFGCVLSRILNGMTALRAFGAPGEWGYGTVIGDVLAVLHRTPPCSLGIGCEDAGMCYAAAHDAPERCGLAENPCKLTECQGKPRCEPCKVMDRAYAPSTSSLDAARHAIDEAIKAAETPRTRRLGPDDESWDDGYLNGVKACGTVVLAALAAAQAESAQ